MKYVGFFLLVFVLFSCSPPSKKEALEYFIEIRFDQCEEVIDRMDEQMFSLQEFMGDPAKMTQGPNAERHKELLIEENEIISEIEKTIVGLEKIDPLGDESAYLETMQAYMKKRLKYERNTILKIIELLEGGLTNKEGEFLGTQTNALLDMQKSQKNLVEVENRFLAEFEITHKEIEKALK